MPISDEVIELAPVKKTKKTLIIMITCMGVLFAAAIAFLVMYLVKPSVTADKNHVKSVSVSAAQLFSELDASGNEVLYASIGNEYTVYSTVTVDDNSSTNVEWIYDKSDIKYVGNGTDENGAYLKFIPNIGKHGKKTTITACAATRLQSSQKIELTIVNQGAEDIRVTQYGVVGNMTQVKDDTYDKVLAITVPYYASAQSERESENNKEIRFNFNQFGKYNAAAKEYSKLTCVEIKNDKNETINTGDVSVTLKDSKDSQYIEILDVTQTEFKIKAKGICDHDIEIWLQANVNNATDCQILKKVIKVKIESNVSKKYVDTMLVFNKPVVDAAFIKKVLTDGSTTQLASSKIRSELGKAENAELKVCSGNQKFVPTSGGFELVLPYNRSVTYNDIYRHVIVNPANIQYAGEKIIDNWYQFIEVSSSDKNVLTVNGTDKGTGAVKLGPIGLSGSIGGSLKCKLTLTDKRPGSAGAKVEIPVRIVAQTTGVSLKVVDDKITYQGEELNNIKAGTGKSYAVSATYNFVAPENITLETFLENSTLSNVYTLKFDKDELEVKLKGSDKTLEPETKYDATTFGTSFKKISGSGNNTVYEAVLDFEVKVKKEDDGAAVFQFTRDGSYLYDSGEQNSITNSDKEVKISAAFNIVQRATVAKIVDEKEGLRVVTDNGKKAGNFVRNSDTKATLYVQRQDGDTQLELITLDNVKQFIDTKKAYFTIQDTKDSFVPEGTGGGGFQWKETIKETNKEKGLYFTSNNFQWDIKQFTLKFNVLDVNGEIVTKDFRLDIYIIDAITKITVPTASKSATYDGEGSAFVKLENEDVKMIRVQGTQPSAFTYNDINIYYNDGGIMFGAKGTDTTKVVNNDNTISFKHTYQEKTTELFVFNAVGNNRMLSIKTDIYAYSRKVGINFGNIELEFLLKDSDEYIGKHTTDDSFSSNDMERMRVAFVRKADDVALFSHADCEKDDAIPYSAKLYTLTENQNIGVYIYACSVVKIGEDTVYVERKSEKNGKIAPVEKATFSLPEGIDPITFDGPANENKRYYNVTLTTPQITPQESKSYVGGKVYYSNAGDDRSLTIVVNNAIRPIKSVAFYNDNACKNSVSELLLGGFINQANKYSDTVYVKVEYDTKLKSHTEFQKLELTLPSYLEIVNGIKDSETGSYILASDKENMQTIDSEIFPCTIRLIRGEEITDNTTITAKPSKNVSDSKNATITAIVKAGLKTLTVKNGNDVVATVTAGTTGTYSATLSLKNKDDIKSLTLGFAYEATDSEGYSIAYDHVGAGLKLVYPTSVNGLTVENNIKAARSEFTLTIDANNVIVLKNEIITLTFTDEYNGANANNVFTLEIYITVELDIYELAFADNTKAEVTVTGSVADNAQEETIVVKYNGGENNVQPTDKVKADNRVLDIYTLNGSEPQKYESGQIYIAKSGDNYKLIVANDIDWSKDYYLGLKYKDLDLVTRKIIIKTTTSHLEFADNNIKLTKVDGTDYYKADVVVKSEDDLFNIIANVVNDGDPDQIESGKEAEYGLYTDWDFGTEASGVSITNGQFKVSAPAKITDTVYYRARYVETKRDNKLYEKKVAITYTIAPSAVALTVPNSDLYDAANKTITLYYKGLSYTSIDLTNCISVTNLFGKDYGTTDIEKAVTTESSLVGINGLTIKPIGVTDNDVTDVTVTISATYAGVKVEEDYTVRIVPVADVSFEDAKGTIDLLDKNSKATATANIGTYAGLKPTYQFAANNNKNLFTISGEGNVKTIALGGNTAKKDTEYKFTGSLLYDFTVTEGSPFSFGGTFGSIATYTVEFVGDHTPKFELYNGTDSIPTYDSVSGDTKFAVTNIVNYSLELSDIPDVPVTYRVEATNGVVSIADFDSEHKATVTLNANTSGKFKVTVYANIGGVEFENTKTYYFMYANDVVAKLYVSQNNSTYNEFSGNSQVIDYKTNPYKFKYEITGLPEGAVVDLAVNGVNGSDITANTTNNNSAATRYVEIRATKPTTLKIGGTVKVGSRTIYLDDKTVTLTATAPEFELKVAGDKTEIMPAGTANFSINSAVGFQGEKTVKYSVSSDTYATIDETSGVLTADKNIVTDQTVVVTATVTVTTGAYAGEKYTVSKEITVKGVPLPTIKWNDEAKVDITVGNTDYSSMSLFTLDSNVTNYTYTNVSNAVISIKGHTLGAGNCSISNGVLTIENTVKAGGTVTLKVTATIGDDIHNGESVSDTITVRVLPIMNENASNITLGNAKAVYDLNTGDYKLAFAPNGVGVNDYSIISLDVPDNINFGVNGANLIVKNDIAAAETVDVTATVVVTEGTFKGVQITGKKQIAIAVPTMTETELNNTFAWDGTNKKYNTINRSIAGVMNVTIGSVASVSATVEGSANEYVTVTVGNNFGIELSVDKEFGAYVDGQSGNKAFNVRYVVALADGTIYSGTSTYKVPKQAVSITADIEGESVTNKAFDIKSGETVLLNLVEANGFSVNITSITTVNATIEEDESTQYLTAVSVGNGVRITADSVYPAKNVKLTLVLSVAGQSASLEYTVTIKATETDAAYTADNTEIYIAKNYASSQEIKSDWSCGKTSYEYGESVTIQVSSGVMSDYFSSIKLGNKTATFIFNIATISFDKSGDNRPSLKEDGFDITFEFKKNASFADFTFTVTLTAYNGPRTTKKGNSTTEVIRYSVHVIDKLTVTLNTNSNGEFVDDCPASVEVSYLGKYIGLPTVAEISRKGYKFKGWYSARTGGDEVTVNTDVKQPTDHTLYAQWEVREYIIAYNHNYYGDNANRSSEYTVVYGSIYDDDVLKYKPTPTRTGYDFVCWTAKSAANSQVITAYTIVEPENDKDEQIILYAQWRKKYFTVTIDAKGGTLYGTNSTLTVQVEYEGTFSLHNAMVPTREGYRFTGWDKPGEVEIKGDTTIEATWVELYTVSFDLNYDDAPEATTAQYANGDTYGTMPTPTRDGYTFNGWHTAENGGTEITIITTVEITADQTLYAHWAQVAFTVTLDANGGTVAGGSTYATTVAKGGDYALHLSTVPTREGFTFNGWYTKATEDGEKKSDTIANVTENITLYAHWTPIPDDTQTSEITEED